MLMHGCKEGQCSACKSFMLDGEVDLDRYSTFALPDFEEAEGWTLLCRAHPYSDLEIELINYDEEIIHGGTPPRTVSTVVEAVEALTSDIFGAQAASPTEPLEFKPGQYVDITIPGTEDEHRSFSMANTDPDDARVHDQALRGRHFSGLLEDGADQARRRARRHRALRGLHAAAQLAAAAAVHRRRRRHGADPLAPAAHAGDREPRARRPTTTARAPRPTCSSSRSWRTLPCGFVPALSEDSNGWKGETGLITDVVDRLEGDVTEVDAYVCGPPPMVEATIALLERKGVPEAHIYFDKFTTTADE